MGVRGLTSFIDNSQTNIGKPIYNYSGTIVIDGDALVYYLCCLIDCVGSNYRQLHQETLKFASSLSECEVYVVFDGPVPEYKFSSTLERNMDRIRNSKKAFQMVMQGKLCSKECQEYLKGLPAPLYQACVIDTLKEFVNIHVGIAMEEADYEIGLLAKKKNAIVISSDSDFFIYDIRGYAPLRKINYDRKCLDIIIYERSRLASLLETSERNLSMVAVLAGTDHFSYLEFQTIQKLNNHVFRFRRAKRFQDIVAFIHSVKATDPDIIESLIAQKLKSHWKNKFKLVFSHANEQYNMLIRSEVNAIFVDPTSIETEDDEWKILMKSGTLNRNFLSMKQGIFWGYTFFENPLEESAFIFSSPIRKAIYSKCRPNQESIEYLRSKDNIKKRFITVNNQDMFGLDANTLLSIKTERDMMILIIQYYIYQRSKNDIPIQSNKVAGLLAGMIASVNSVTITYATPSAEAISIASHLEAIMEGYSILMSFYKWKSSDWFWKCLDGKCLYFYIDQSRNEKFNLEKSLGNCYQLWCDSWKHIVSGKSTGQNHEPIF